MPNPNTKLERPINGELLDGGASARSREAGPRPVFADRGRTLRILQVNKYYAPWIGGIETAVQEMAEGLLALPNVECEVLVCRDRGRGCKSLVNGVPVTRVTSLGRVLSMPVAPTFPLELQAIATGFDIVHVHTPFPLAVFCDWEAIRARGVRLVVHHHSDIVRPLQQRVHSCLSGFERRFLTAADRIVVTSHGLLENSRTLAQYRDKCQVVPLSVDLRKVKRLSEVEIAHARQHYGLGDRERAVLFAGRLVYYKGIQFLIDAVRDLDLKLLIAGEGPLRPTLERQIEERGLGSKVRILGRVTNSELANLYSISDLFVLPSTEPAEAFGLVQLDAMAYGLPVINTDLPGGVPSVSIHGQTGLTVPPGNTAALREAVATILSDERLRTQLSENARRRVLSFSRPAVLGQLCSIYEELVSPHVLS
jgi:glycosyltransferase involved in cell wall biosynthesis